MSTIKRILNSDLAVGKSQPLIQAEAVITLFYHMQSVAPHVCSDLIMRTSAARIPEDLKKAVAEWAVEWGLCGPAGPTEWALLIGLGTAKSIPIPSGAMRDLPNGDYLTLPPVVDQATGRRLTSAAGRVLVDIETAKAVFSGMVTPVPHGPYLLLGDFGRSSSDHVDRYVPAHWRLTLYRRSIRKRCAALNPQPLMTARPLRITIEFSETNPAVDELIEKVTRAIGDQVRQHTSAAIQLTRCGRPSVDKREQVRNVIWFIRHQILRESLSEIGRTANKFIRNDSADHPRTCDRGTVARGVRHVAEVLGVVLRIPERGGRPIGRKDSQRRNRPSKNR
jgi:hypothetical protein